MAAILKCETPYWTNSFSYRLESIPFASRGGDDFHPRGEVVAAAFHVQNGVSAGDVDDRTEHRALRVASREYRQRAVFALDAMPRHIFRRFRDFRHDKTRHMAQFTALEWRHLVALQPRERLPFRCEFRRPCRLRLT